MNKASRHRLYNQTKIATANPGMLIVMLYDGAIKFLKQAQVAIASKELENAHNSIIRAEAIIVELMSSLKMDVGGEIAQNLYRIYDYIYHTLIEANTKKDSEKIESVVSMLISMKRTWEEVIVKEAEAKKTDKKTDSPEQGKQKSFNIAI